MSDATGLERLDVYALFEQFEKQAGEIYYKLNYRFRDQPDLPDLFREMEADEFDHARMIELCRQRRTLADVTITNDTVQGLEELFRRANNILNSSDVTLEQAFLIAIALETSELDTIFARLVEPLESPYIVSVRMRSSLKTHHDRLSRAALQHCPTLRVLRALDKMGSA